MKLTKKEQALIAYGIHFLANHLTSAGLPKKEVFEIVFEAVKDLATIFISIENTQDLELKNDAEELLKHLFKLKAFDDGIDLAIADFERTKTEILFGPKNIN